MSSNDRELFELIGKLPSTAKMDLMAMANWMAAADYSRGGPLDGCPVVGMPELVEQTDYHEKLIVVYRRGENGLTYQGYRPCCDDKKCACIYGESDCIHGRGEVTRCVKDIESEKQSWREFLESAPSEVESKGGAS